MKGHLHGKSSSDATVMPPDATVAFPNTAIYDMIRFWGRKPWNIVRRHIERYTKEGEVVFDPFAGCGVVAIEALKTRRRAIYNDLNAFLHFLARASCKPVDVDKLKHYSELLTENVYKKEHKVTFLNDKGTKTGSRLVRFDWLYSTFSPRNGVQGRIDNVIYELSYKPVKDIRKLEALSRMKRERRVASLALTMYELMRGYKLIRHSEIVEKAMAKKKVPPELYTRALGLLEESGLIVNMGETPIRIRFSCEGWKCEKGEKKPDADDLNKLADISRMEPPYYYPKDPLHYPSGERFLTKRPGTDSVDKLFTRRTLIALSIIWHEIEELDVEDNIKEALMLCFAAILEHVSKMQRPNKKGWDAKNYIIRPVFLEQDVYPVFKNRFQTIVKGKEESGREIGSFYIESVDPARVLDGETNVCFSLSDARELSFGADSVDYVFTDPEYGDSIQYYELTYMASKWLRFDTDWQKEIVVNLKQGKTPEIYRDSLVEAFKKVHQILKAGRYMTITFHSRQIKYWNALMYAIQVAGFRYVSSVYQTPQKEYTNWLYRLNPGSMSGDIYITFRKPSAEERAPETSKTVDIDQVIQNVILPEAREIIFLHDGQATYNQLVRGITLRLINEGLMHAPEVRDLNYVKLFDYNFRRIGKMDIWGTKKDEQISAKDFIPLEKRIEWIIFSVFNEKKGGKVLINDVLAAIFTTLANAKTPENEEILKVLERVAVAKQQGGQPYWEMKKEIQVTLDQVEATPPRVPIKLAQEPEEDMDHARVIRLMCEIGKKLGYDVWIGDPEVKKDPDLKEHATVDELKIPGLDDKALKRLRNDDVVWLMKGRGIPVALIEVEHTTDPRSGLLRMANVFEELPHLNVRAVTIIPDRKIAALQSIPEEPSIKRLIGEKEILYSTYSKVAELFDDLDEVKSIDDFNQICKRLSSEAKGKGNT